MARPVFMLLSMAFRTLLICCAVYVYMEAANPWLARRVQSIPYVKVDVPVFDVLGRHWDRFVDIAGIPVDWRPPSAGVRGRS